MKKQEFLAVLRDRLRGLPQEDIQRSVDYYSEMIDDRMEDGLREESAVAALGSMDEIVSQILMETSLPKLVKAKVKRSTCIHGRLCSWFWVRRSGCRCLLPLWRSCFRFTL